MVVGTPVRISKFLGMNTKVIPEMIEDVELSDMLNMDFDFRDSLRTRYGYSKVLTGTPNDLPTSGLYVYRKTGTIDQILFTSGSKLYKVAGNSPEEIFSGIYTKNRVSFTQFQDTVFFGDGKNSLRSYTGTAVNLVSIPDEPGVQFIICHKNRLFAAGSQTFPGFLYFSSLENPLDWRSPLSGGSGGVIRVARDNDYITGLGILADSVIVFTRRSIYMLYVDGDPETDWILRKSNSDIGCVNGFTIVSVDNGIYFLSERGISMFNGVRTNVVGNALSFDNFNAATVSEKIEKKTRSDQKALFDYSWNMAVASYFDYKYRICVSDANKTNYYAFVLDTRRNAWTFYDNYKFNCFALGTSSSKSVLYAGSSEDGQIYEIRNFDFPFTTDDGEPIKSYFITKAYNFVGFEFVSEFRHTFVSYYTGSNAGIWYSYSVDFKDFYDVEFPLRGVDKNTPVWAGTDGVAPDPWSMSTWASPLDSDVVFRDIPHYPKKGRTLRLKFANYTENQDALTDYPNEQIVPFVVYHFEHYYKPRRARNVRLS